MNIEIVTLIGLIFAAASLARFVYERRMDVLHGPYIEGRSTQPVPGKLLKPLMSVVDRVCFRLRGMAFLASIAAC